MIFELKNSKLPKRIVFISGLGADETAFSKLGDLGYQKVYAKWLLPKEGEHISSYASRMISKYNITFNDVLVGLSFGGLVAQQIAALNNNKKVILVSSFLSKENLPSYLYFGLTTGLYRFTPKKQFDFINKKIADKLNSGHQSSRKVLLSMLEKSDMNLVKWSVHQIAVWKPIANPAFELHSLQGTNDLLVKSWETHNKHMVQDGTHFMVHDRADEITGIIANILAED